MSSDVNSEKSVVQNLTEPELFRKVGHICTLVNTVYTRSDLLEGSLKETMRLFKANRGSIYILKGDTNELVLESSQGMQAEEQKNIVKRLGQGVVGQVAQLMKPIVVQDIAADDRFEKYKARQSYATPSFICAPLVVKDKLIGVINIADKESGSRFSDADMQLLDFLTSQIALNYKRLQLYKKFKSIVKETKKLKDQLGQSDQQQESLKKQIFIQEKLATIGKLAGGIAHEFNNPLDGVLRYTNLCLDQTEEEDVRRGYLLEIKQGLKRMANIVKNLLACSRHDVPTKDKISFDMALESTLSALRTQMEHKNIDIELDVQEDIPLMTDLGLERILTNLMRNAADALPDDGGFIRVAARYDRGSLMFTVEDTGTGIEEENIEKVFEPFFTTKDIDRGCGLGLTIVAEIVKTYDGKVNIESTPGQGTMFTITLPIDGYNYDI